MQAIKMTWFLLITLFALLAAAGQLASINATSKGLSWTGEVPGHGLVTLDGCVETIEEQIFNLAPHLRENYAATNLTNPFMSPTPRPFNETLMTVSHFSYSYNPTTLGNETSVVARDDINPVGLFIGDLPGPAHWYCGNFATGSYEEAYAAIARLLAPAGVAGGMWDVGQSGGPGLPMCVRLACSGSTAVYWCNDNEYSVTTDGETLASVASMVAEGYNLFNWFGCCLTTQNRGANNQYSGQVFVGNGTNVIMGWGNCTIYDYFIDPSTLPTPGPMGLCF